MKYRHNQLGEILCDSIGHWARIQDSDFNDSFQVADIHQVELNGSERHEEVIWAYA